MAFTVYDYNYDLKFPEVGGQVTVTNNLGRAALFGEFVNLGGFFGYVADFAGIANAAAGRIALIDENVSVSTAQIEVTNTLAVGDDLFFVGGGSSAAGKFTNVNAAGAIYVGKVVAEQGAGGAQTAVQFRPCPVLAATGSGGVKVARVIIDAATDYSTTGKAANIPLGSTILDVVAVATATASGGTAQVMNGASAVHTALVMATDQAVTRMAAGVDDTKLAVAAAITVKTHAIGDAGIVTIYYI